MTPWTFYLRADLKSSVHFLNVDLLHAWEIPELVTYHFSWAFHPSILSGCSHSAGGPRVCIRGEVYGEKWNREWFGEKWFILLSCLRCLTKAWAFGIQTSSCILHVKETRGDTDLDIVSLPPWSVWVAETLSLKYDLLIYFNIYIYIYIYIYECHDAALCKTLCVAMLFWILSCLFHAWNFGSVWSSSCQYLNSLFCFI